MFWSESIILVLYSRNQFVSGLILLLSYFQLNITIYFFPMSSNCHNRLYKEATFLAW